MSLCIVFHRYTCTGFHTVLHLPFSIPVFFIPHPPFRIPNFPFLVLYFPFCIPSFFISNYHSQFQFSTPKSAFSIPNSPFSILNSPFSILHSPFSILHSQFSIPIVLCSHFTADPVLAAEVATFMDCVKLTADQVAGA